MPSAHLTVTSHGNLLLDMLEKNDRDRMLSKTRPVPLHLKDVVFERNRTIGTVYFPLVGVISILNFSDDGSPVETATVGPEGVAGLSAIFGDHTMRASEGVVQVGGSALAMSADAFREEFEGEANVRRLVLDYLQAYIVQISQSVACNARHGILERCARWLLQTHDRARADEFRLTQEFLAQMLGVRRPSVTVAAGALQEAGLIHYKRGDVTVLDRAGLERASCECYRIVRDEYDHAIGAGRTMRAVRHRARAARHPTHSAVQGMASSRSSGMGSPQASHTP